MGGDTTGFFLDYLRDYPRDPDVLRREVFGPADGPAQGSARRRRLPVSPARCARHGHLPMRKVAPTTSASTSPRRPDPQVHPRRGQQQRHADGSRILEIEGLPQLTVEQAFELSDASAERSAGGCTIALSAESVAEYLRSNVVMLRWMIANGYQDARSLERRARAMEEWLAKPTLLRADADAQYAEIIEIDMDAITKPLLARPNDPDDVKPLSEVAGTTIDEVLGKLPSVEEYMAYASKIDSIGAGDLPLPELRSHAGLHRRRGAGQAHRGGAEGGVKRGAAKRERARTASTTASLAPALRCLPV